jgi:hypothetical protein
MPAAKQIFQCLRPGITQLSAIAKIASIPSHLPTNAMIKLLLKPKL